MRWIMPDYHVGFWSGERGHLVCCDIVAGDGSELLDGLSDAGRYAIALRRMAAPPGGGLGGLPSNGAELAWLGLVCGPLWLFVAASYLIAPGG
jgi:hypothetical protein